MADRFYYDGTWSEVVTLSGSEAQHLAKVLRKQIGETVELFDGCGTRVECCITSISKRDVQLKLTTELQLSKQVSPRVVLAVAPPKGDRFRWLIEKATELGVERIIPIQTERSVVKPGGAKLEKLRQTMISACKQSRRDHFMEISPFTKLSSLAEAADLPAARFYGDAPIIEDVRSNSVIACGISEIIAFIGPEGGFSSEEIELLNRCGAQPLSASPHVLRVETAAIALCSLLIASQRG